jgi:hypothetical protein
MGDNYTYKKWERFRVIKKFTFFPLRIYQYTSQTTWWSWMETTYVLQIKRYHSESDNPIQYIYSYFLGHFWTNERISWEEEYNDYVNNKSKV